MSTHRKRATTRPLLGLHHKRQGRTGLTLLEFQPFFVFLHTIHIPFLTSTHRQEACCINPATLSVRFVYYVVRVLASFSVSERKPIIISRLFSQLIINPFCPLSPSPAFWSAQRHRFHLTLSTGANVTHPLLVLVLDFFLFFFLCRVLFASVIEAVSLNTDCSSFGTYFFRVPIYKGNWSFNLI